MSRLQQIGLDRFALFTADWESSEVQRLAALLEKLKESMDTVAEHERRTAAHGKGRGPGNRLRRRQVKRRQIERPEVRGRWQPERITRRSPTDMGCDRVGGAGFVHGGLADCRDLARTQVQLGDGQHQRPSGCHRRHTPGSQSPVRGRRVWHFRFSASVCGRPSPTQERSLHTRRGCSQYRRWLSATPSPNPLPSGRPRVLRALINFTASVA